MMSIASHTLRGGHIRSKAKCTIPILASGLALCRDNTNVMWDLGARALQRHISMIINTSSMIGGCRVLDLEGFLHFVQ